MMVKTKTAIVYLTHVIAIISEVRCVGNRETAHIFCLLHLFHVFVEFVEQPSSLNVTQGATAVFNCTGYSQGYHWLVNNKALTNEENSGRSLTVDNTVVNADTNLKIHLLQVPATPINDDIKIRCLIYDTKAISSTTAVLQIQGNRILQCLQQLLPIQ